MPDWSKTEKPSTEDSGQKPEFAEKSVENEPKTEPDAKGGKMPDEDIAKASDGKADWFKTLERLAEETGVEDSLAWLKGLGRKYWIAIAAAAFVVFLSGCSAAYLLTNSPNLADPDQEIFVHVASGDRAKDVAKKLEQKGVIGNRHLFVLQVKLNGVADQFKKGTYTFHGNMTSDEVIAKLVAGETTVIKFTIPEGFGIKEIAERLSKEGLVNKEKFLQKAKDFAPYDYIEEHADVRYRAEGFLFPDTYTIQTEMNEEEIMEMMAADLDHRLTPKLRRRAKEMDLSLYELITLASLVEKEARYDEDRPIIAQVFFKRLELGMPLQTDASLQYLMDAPKEDVLISDTKIESPYNTYQNQGLPPGPIASPGMAAIEAVLYPADTDYLYFVADRDGHNHYSYAYSDHLDLVDQVR